jgi:hypothetical protein
MYFVKTTSLLEEQSLQKLAKQVYKHQKTKRKNAANAEIPCKRTQLCCKQLLGEFPAITTTSNKRDTHLRPDLRNIPKGLSAYWEDILKRRNYRKHFVMKINSKKNLPLPWQCLTTVGTSWLSTFWAHQHSVVITMDVYSTSVADNDYMWNQQERYSFRTNVDEFLSVRLSTASNYSTEVILTSKSENHEMVISGWLVKQWKTQHNLIFRCFSSF